MIRNYCYIYIITAEEILFLTRKNSFVNSQEWTLSRTVPELKVGVIGSTCSGKSALVHRYLTGSYMQEESPEGGRFKKEIVVDGQSYLLLIRDEGGPPELQFCSWVDAVILVFSVEDETSFNMLYHYYAKIAHHRNTAELPMILVGTQDAVNETSPRLIDDNRAKKLSHDLKRCPFYETCAMYGLNVDRVFNEIAQRITDKRSCTHIPTALTHNSNSVPSTPQATRSNNFVIPGSLHVHQGGPGSSSSSTQSITQPSQYPVQQQQQPQLPVTPTGHPRRDITKDFTRDPQLPSPSSTPNVLRRPRRKQTSGIFTVMPKSSKGGDVKHTQPDKLGSGRAIPIKQGWLYKRSNKALNKEWKKKYVALNSDGQLTYHSTINDYMNDSHGKDIRLMKTTVKVPGRRPQLARGSTTNNNKLGSAANDVTNDMKHMSLVHPNHSAIAREGSLSSHRPDLTPNQSKSSSLPRDMGFEAVIISNSSVTPGISNDLELCGQAGSGLSSAKDKKKHKRMRSVGGSKNANNDYDESEEYEFHIVSLVNKQWYFAASSSEERDEWVQAIEAQIMISLQGNMSSKCKDQIVTQEKAAVIQEIRKIPGNGFCADCEDANPDWASINLGALICIECSGIHRNLGTHVSKVRSLDLDDWPAELLCVMMCIGNTMVNNIWEVSLNSRTKPNSNSNREEKERWIRSKYERKEYLAPIPNPEKRIGQQLLEAVTIEEIRLVILLLAQATPLDVNHRYGEGDGRSALHLSCALANVVLTQLLIWYNADVTAVDADGRTALVYARSVGAEDCVKVLLNNGCPDDYPKAASNGSLHHGSRSPNKNVIDKLPASVI
ncbi:arf-GAP with GTPase, ANK repeat and PH domain-containing protein 1-like isoform X3 [Anneissia japonica]|uniref:arf-GAP with GTPase, ANK repeat and PH domain-containing protein 1-like isoform X3 n=1 Tax=Anneissia japonica TaxID=1529436 RepID=UPI001425BB78|nr:arf-GAP with GTPase, ANK repeat and PH domain-containing protein 1-like isoform X3 [Anneissia japonica]